jgi:hypothetical protein
LSPENGLVVDPFLGSGISALEAIRLRRRIIGIDVNPVAIRIARLLLSPPAAAELGQALAHPKKCVQDSILDSYVTMDGKPATHYVWRGRALEKVWTLSDEGHKRVEIEPSPQDLSLVEQYATYKPRRLREARFFDNSRINSSSSLALNDLFTGRALRNIELLIDAINELPSGTREAFRLALTAAVGQMSKMVFAITGRGKTTGKKADRMEVGSWVIGYWRPEQHFEVNAWNCFERRAKKFIKAIVESESTNVAVKEGDVSSVCAGRAGYSLILGDTLEVLPQMPDGSVDLIITDPPHSDRIPYLELSEIWNIILDECPAFESEIVVSNAPERIKTAARYHEAMTKFLETACRKLKGPGFLVLFFNARTEESWEFLKDFTAKAGSAGMVYCGRFPLVYSATSVVQDNRHGALRTDYGLVYSHSAKAGQGLVDIPGWSSTMRSESR